MDDNVGDDLGHEQSRGLDDVGPLAGKRVSDGPPGDWYIGSAPRSCNRSMLTAQPIA